MPTRRGTAYAAAGVGHAPTEPDSLPLATRSLEDSSEGTQVAPVVARTHSGPSGAVETLAPAGLSERAEVDAGSATVDAAVSSETLERPASSTEPIVDSMTVKPESDSSTGLTDMITELTLEVPSEGTDQSAKKRMPGTFQAEVSFASARARDDAQTLRGTQESKSDTEEDFQKAPGDS